MSTFYLIRHGDKHPIPPDPGLNDLGHTQAKTTAQYLKKLPITKIIASPLRRTQETAQHIANQLNLHVETDNRLRERLNWGDDPTQSREDFIELWRKTSQDRSFTPHIGLSSQAAGKSLESLILEEAQNIHKHIALVTHGGIIADFLRNIFTEDQLLELYTTYPDGFDYEVKECSITEIYFDEDLKLVRANDVSHLQ